MKEKIYLCGTLVGEDKSKVVATFSEAEARLEGLGYETINPLKNALPDTVDGATLMLANVIQMLQCKTIYIVNDIMPSKRAMQELGIARQMKLITLHYMQSDRKIREQMNELLS